MPRLIFFIAILILLLVGLAKLCHRIYWILLNAKNHGKGRVIKRKVNGKVSYVVQLYKEFDGWLDIPGLKYSTIGDALTAMDKALEKSFDEEAHDTDEQVIVEREYRQHR